MSELPPFAIMAIELRQRANLSILDLSERASTSKNNIYWAEGSSPDRDISAKLLRLIYRPLCKDEAEWTKLLLLWAINKDENQVRIRGSFADVLSSIEPETTSYEISANALATDFIALNYKQRQLILRVIRALPNCPDFEKLISIMLDSFVSLAVQDRSRLASESQNGAQKGPENQTPGS